MKKILFFMLLSLSAVCSDAQTAWNTHLVGRWADTSLTVNTIGQVYNDVWGYSQNGREYGIIGSTEGVHFIDITDSASFTEVDRLVGTSFNTIHRDFANYRNYLYVVSDQDPLGLQVVDMQYLPDSIHLLPPLSDALSLAHELFVDTAMQKLYVFGARDTASLGFLAMKIYSIVNPAQPVFLDTFVHPTFWYVHDGYVRNDTAWLHCGAEGFYCGYFGNPSQPVEIGTLEFYPDQGYNHSGWPSADGRYYVMADETPGMRLKILNMQPGPNLLSFHGLFGSGVTPFSVAHNPYVIGNLVYVSYYHDGLRIFNMADVDNPVQVAYYDTYPGNADSASFAGAWGAYPFLPSGRVLVSDMQYGLFVVDANWQILSAPPTEEEKISLYPNPGAGMVYIQGLPEGASYEVTVANTTGSIVRRFSAEGNAFTLDDLAAGVYQVTLVCGGQRYFFRLVRS